jgi:hypothetical protein
MEQGTYRWMIVGVENIQKKSWFNGGTALVQQSEVTAKVVTTVRCTFA